MKLSHLKNIIKEQLQQLQNQKSLLTEGCPGRIIWEGTVQCLCGCDGYLTLWQMQNCSVHQDLNCGGCPEPCPEGGSTGGRRGTGRAPMDPTIG